MSYCQLICPNLRCRKILKVPEEARNKIVRCQHCQSLLRVPPARVPVAGLNVHAPPSPSSTAGEGGAPARQVA